MRFPVVRKGEMYGNYLVRMHAMYEKDLVPVICKVHGTKEEIPARDLKKIKANQCNCEVKEIPLVEVPQIQRDVLITEVPVKEEVKEVLTEADPAPAKMTAEIAREIRHLAEVDELSVEDICEKVGFKRAQVSKIISYKTWKDA